jgi:cytochrome c oxidase assembly factor CtaG
MKYFDIICGSLTILSFVLYLFEFSKRRKQGSMMNMFLHGMKPLVVGMAAGGNPIWQEQLRQLNDMLERLQPPKKKK